MTSRDDDARTRSAPARANIWIGPSITVAVTALAVWLGWLIHRRVILANHPLSWDEGAHSLFALTIATDIRRGDLIALAYDTYRQVYWPPLHSWITGLAFLAFGDRIAVARDVSLVSTMLLPLSLLAAGRLMYRRVDALGGWTAAATAAVLSLAVPAFIPMATLAFLEAPALLTLMLTLIAAFVAERAPDKPRRRMLVGVGILAVFLCKTNYGVLLIGVFGLDALIEARWSVRRLMVPRNVYLAAPLVVGLAIWFAYPPKLAGTIRAMINKPAGADAWTIEGLLFYPRALVTLAGSPVVLGVLLGLVAGTWRLRRQPNVRLLMLLATAQFVLGQIHHTKDDRHILPMFPPLLLLAGVTVASLAAIAADGRTVMQRRLSAMVCAAVALVATVQLWMLPQRPFPRALEPAPPGPAYRELVSLVTSATGRGERVLVVGTFDLSPGPTVIDWHLAVDERLLDVERSGAIGIVDRDRGVAGALRRAPLPSAIANPLMRVLERSDAVGAVRTVHAGLPDRASPADFAASFTETLYRGKPDLVILATSALPAPAFPLEYFTPMLASALLTPISSRVVDAPAPMRIDVYRVSRTSD